MLVTNQSVKQYSVVKVTEYQVNFVQDRKILILLQGEPAQHPAYAIGTPVNLHVLAGGGGGAPSTEQPDPAPYGAAAGAPGAGGYGAAASSSSSSSAAVVRTPAVYGYGAGAGGGGGGGGAGGGGAGSQATPISALNPYVNRWTIKVRVTSKSDVRTWSNPKSSGSMFKVELLDEAGSEIGAAFFKEAVAKFFDVVTVGSVYYMGGGKVKVADPKWSNGRQYEITFDEKSTVTPASEDAAIARVTYNFTPIAAVAQKDKDALVDVLGVLSEVRDKQDIHTKAGKDMTKREVVLTDSSGAGGASAIELTLWGEKASKGELAVGQVVAIKNAKVSEWNSRSLSMMQSSSMAVDPDMPEAHQLRGWFEGGGRQTAPAMLSERGRGSGMGGGGGAALAADTDLTLRHDVRSLKGGEGGENLAIDAGSLLVVKATIKHIRNDVEKISYPACRTVKDGGRQCNKKLENTGGGWQCPNCGQVEGPEHRYMLSTCLQDASGDNFATIFDQEAIALLGMKADALLQLSGVQPGSDGAGGEPSAGYMRVFQQQLFTQHLFTIRVKLDNYKDEQKLSATVIKMRPLKGALLVQECASLVAQIKKYLSA